MCYAEGMKAGLDVCARLSVTSGESYHPSWWSADQLKQLCVSWERSLYDLTASNFGAVESKKKDYFNDVGHS